LLTASDSGYKPEKGCLPNTCTAVINDIKQWIHLIGGEASKQVYWLDGPAGAGKSAIAHTVARYCRDNKLLGCMFCFSTSVQGQNHRLFATISQSLAKFDPEWGKSLAKVLQNSHDLCTTSSLQLQFEELLLKPAKDMEERVVGPIVVVIDGLDECGSDSARRELLSFTTCLMELPSFFRFLITARQDQDMVDKLTELKQLHSVSHCNLGELKQLKTDKDIYILMDKRLSNEPSIVKDPKWTSSMID
jgi:hypothetical protein